MWMEQIYSKEGITQSLNSEQSLWNQFEMLLQSQRSLWGKNVGPL